jgi:hypothetical protein
MLIFGQSFKKISQLHSVYKVIKIGFGSWLRIVLDFGLTVGYKATNGKSEVVTN